MKKVARHFWVCFLLILFCLTAGETVLAGTYGDFQYLLNSSTGEIEITEYTGSGGSVVIPSEISGFPVTSIKDVAFENHTDVTKVSFAAGSKVKTLGYHTFGNCSGMVSIELPKSLREIGQGCFQDCSGLTSIAIPEGVTEFGNSLYGNNFKGCVSLASVKLPSTLTMIGAEAFEDCKSLKQVSLPDGLTLLCSEAFSGTGLTSIVIPEGVTQISDGVFENCTSLKSVKMSANVKRISGRAFVNCSALESLGIPVDLEVIEENAISGCPSLKSLTFGDVVTSTAWGDDWRLFADCPNLTVRVVRGSKIHAYCMNFDIPHVVYASSLAGCTVDGIVDKTYTGSKQKQSLKISLGSDKLKQGTDYKVAYSGNVNVGTATMVITGIGNYVGKLEKTFRIEPADISKCKVKLSKTSMVYAAKYLKPSVTVTFNGKKVASSNYEVSYAYNMYVGTAMVTVSGTGNLINSRQLTFFIVPKATKLKTVKALSKGFQATWKENTVQTSGYQLQYSLKKTFKSSRKINIQYANSKTYTVNKLKGAKTYYVRIRCFNQVDGKMYYSAWSKPVTVKTKK